MSYWVTTDSTYQARTRIPAAAGAGAYTAIKPQESQAQATQPEPTHPDTRETITQGQCQRCGYPGPGSTRQLVDGLCGCCRLRHATVVRTEFTAVCVQALDDAERVLRADREQFTRNPAAEEAPGQWRRHNQALSVYQRLTSRREVQR